jgi:hypothetical protein
MRMLRNFYSHILVVRMKNGKATLENSVIIYQKLTILKLLCDLKIPLYFIKFESVKSQETLNENIYSNIIYNGQNN